MLSSIPIWMPLIPIALIILMRRHLGLLALVSALSALILLALYL